MPVLLLTYDLNDEKTQEDRQKFDEVVESYNNQRRLSESSYALSTNESPTDVYIKLRDYLDDNDRVYILTLNLEFASHLAEQDEIGIWLRNHLPH
jgi:sugar-specific transcriptional regulator TrmB